MAGTPFLAKLGLRTLTAGSAASLALSIGPAHDDANRTGFYADSDTTPTVLSTVVGGTEVMNVTDDATVNIGAAAGATDGGLVVERTNLGGTLFKASRGGYIFQAASYSNNRAIWEVSGDGSSARTAGWDASAGPRAGGGYAEGVAFYCDNSTAGLEIDKATGAMTLFGGTVTFQSNETVIGAVNGTQDAGYIKFNANGGSADRRWSIGGNGTDLLIGSDANLDIITVEDDPSDFVSIKSGFNLGVGTTADANWQVVVGPNDGGNVYIGDTGAIGTMATGYALVVRSDANTDGEQVLISRSSFGAMYLGGGTSQGFSMGSADFNGGNQHGHVMLGYYGTTVTNRFTAFGTEGGNDRNLNVCRTHGTNADVAIWNAAGTEGRVVFRVQGQYDTVGASITQTADLLQVGYWDGAAREDKFTITASGQAIHNFGVAGGLAPETNYLDSGASIVALATENSGDFFAGYNAAGNRVIVLNSLDGANPDGAGFLGVYEGDGTTELFGVNSNETRSANRVIISNSNASTSTTTGALTVAGGVGIAGAAYVGGDLVPLGNQSITSNVIIGLDADTIDDNEVECVVIGNGAYADSSYAVVIGSNSFQDGGEDSIIIGDNGFVNGAESIAIGSAVRVGDDATSLRSIAIGSEAIRGNHDDSNQIGFGSQLYGDRTQGLGNYQLNGFTQAPASDQILLGHGAAWSGANTMQIGGSRVRLTVTGKTGNFSDGEVVTGGTSGATAVAVDNAFDDTFDLAMTSAADFVVAETITGATSGHTATVATVDFATYTSDINTVRFNRGVETITFANPVSFSSGYFSGDVRTAGDLYVVREDTTEGFIYLGSQKDTIGPIGVLRFTALNDAATPETVIYGDVYCAINSPTDGSEYGTTYIRAMNNGVLEPGITLSPGEDYIRLESSNRVRVYNTTSTTSFTNNAFSVAGGASVSGLFNVAGVVRLTNTTDSGSSTAGGVIISGGVGIAKKLNVSGGVPYNNSVLNIQGKGDTTTASYAGMNLDFGFGKTANTGSMDALVLDYMGTSTQATVRGIVLLEGGINARSFYGTNISATVTPETGVSSNFAGHFASITIDNVDGQAQSVFGADLSAESAAIATAGNDTVYGVRATAATRDGTAYGIYASASDAGTTGTVWAGYFSGDIKVTAVADIAATRVGYSTVAATSTLTHTISAVEQTAGGITTSLWASPSTGDKVSIRNAGGAAANTVSGNGNNIDGSATFTLNDGESATFIFNGTQWVIF